MGVDSNNLRVRIFLLQPSRRLVKCGTENIDLIGSSLSVLLVQQARLSSYDNKHV